MFFIFKQQPKGSGTLGRAPWMCFGNEKHDRGPSAMVRLPQQQNSDKDRAVTIWRSRAPAASS